MNSCSICLSDINNNEITISCGHKYHILCLMNLIKSDKEKDMKCCLCRCELDKKMIIEKYGELYTKRNCTDETEFFNQMILKCKGVKKYGQHIYFNLNTDDWVEYFRDLASIKRMNENVSETITIEKITFQILGHVVLFVLKNHEYKINPILNNVDKTHIQLSDKIIDLLSVIENIFIVNTNTENMLKTGSLRNNNFTTYMSPATKCYNKHKKTIMNYNDIPWKENADYTFFPCIYITHSKTKKESEKLKNQEDFENFYEYMQYMSNFLMLPEIKMHGIIRYFEGQPSFVHIAFWTTHLNVYLKEKKMNMSWDDILDGM